MCCGIESLEINHEPIGHWQEHLNLLKQQVAVGLNECIEIGLVAYFGEELANKGCLLTGFSSRHRDTRQESGNRFYVFPQILGTHRADLGRAIVWTDFDTAIAFDARIRVPCDTAALES